MARGDHLYYLLGGGSYSHHGIDCGDGTVIHYELTPWMKLTGQVSKDNPARVKRTSVEEFSQGNEIFIRPYDQSKSEVFGVEKSMERAEGRIGEEGYSIFGNNCEHFVVWYKTGVADSTQVDAHEKAFMTVVKGSPIGYFVLRAARRVPHPYKTISTLGAFGLAGVVYLATYVKHRYRNVHEGLS